MSPSTLAQVARRRAQGLVGLVTRLREVQDVIEASTISSLRAVAVLPSTLAGPTAYDRSYMSGSFAAGSRCYATNSHGAFEIRPTPSLGRPSHDLLAPDHSQTF